MEYRKMTPGPVQPAAELPPPERNLQAHLRLMARRQLHGTRGLLYIVGSVVMVITLGGFASTSGLFGNLAGGTGAVFDRWSDEGLSPGEWQALGEVMIGIFVVSCGWLVVRKPRLATRLPMLLLLVKAAMDIVLPLSRDEKIRVNAAFVDVVLAAVLVKAVRDAGAFHRDMVNLRTHVQMTMAPPAPGGWRARLPGYTETSAAAETTPEMPSGESPVPPRKPQIPPRRDA